MEVGRARINWRIFEARCIPPLLQQQQGSNSGQFILKRNNWVLLTTKDEDRYSEENSEVARLMTEKRGEGRGSILQGSSVHNQRMERLWRSIREIVTEYFLLLFHFSERNNLVNPNDELDLAALHYVFIPRSNENLEKLKVSWNNHKLSTVKQKTSNQLYILGMLNLFGSEYTAVKEFFESNIIDSHHNGVGEPDVIDAASEEEAVVVPEAMLYLFNASLQEL